MKQNKPVKVNYNGRHQSYLDLDRTAWGRFKFKLKRFFRQVFIWSCVGLTAWLLFFMGGVLNPATIVTKAEVIKEVDAPAPVLDRIADCESGKRTPSGKAIKGSATHYAKSGQVIMVGNKNLSVDVGKYAINSVWFGKATEMGLDITKEEDNTKMAMWIYKNRGTGDWSSSANCWK